MKNHAVDNVQDKSLADCLRSPFFLAIRLPQPFDDNLLRACILIDHTKVLCPIYAERRPIPTHPGALALVDGHGPGLDEFAQSLAPILDRPWQEYFLARNFRPPAGPGQPRPEGALALESSRS